MAGTKIKRSEIPMQSIEDLKKWHQSQIDRYVALLASREKVVVGRYRETLERGDRRFIDFHQRAVDVCEEAIMSELRVQAALL